jgi:hypothetical protein
VVTNLVRSLAQREIEIGDRWYPYRGLPSMFLHVFRWRELAADLNSAGLRVIERIALDAPRRAPLKRPWFLAALRTNGWIVTSEA